MNTQSNIDTKIVDFPTEENGNFYFIKKYDEKLYKLLLDTEGLIKTDIKNCAKGFRDCLTRFFYLISEKYPEFEAIVIEKARDPNMLSVWDYINAIDTFNKEFSDKELKINSEKLRQINRKIANYGAHWEQNSVNERPDYTIIRNGFIKLQKIFIDFFSAEHPNDKKNLSQIKYRENFQPIFNLTEIFFIVRMFR